MQLIYRPDNGEILGVHIFGLHAADLIHEASNAIALGTRVQVYFVLPYMQCLGDFLFRLERRHSIIILPLYLRCTANTACK